MTDKEIIQKGVIDMEAEIDAAVNIVDNYILEQEEDLLFLDNYRDCVYLYAKKLPPIEAMRVSDILGKSGYESKEALQNFERHGELAIRLTKAKNELWSSGIFIAILDLYLTKEEEAFELYYTWTKLSQEEDAKEKRIEAIRKEIKLNLQKYRNGDDDSNFVEGLVGLRDKLQGLQEKILQDTATPEAYGKYYMSSTIRKIDVSIIATVILSVLIGLSYFWPPLIMLPVIYYVGMLIIKRYHHSNFLKSIEELQEKFGKKG